VTKEATHRGSCAWKGDKAAQGRFNLLYARAKGRKGARSGKEQQVSKAKETKSATKTREADLDAKIKAITADPDYFKKDSPRHAELSAKARELYELRYGKD
jgi:translation initiation factor IF-3